MFLLFLHPETLQQRFDEEEISARTVAVHGSRSRKNWKKEKNGTIGYTAIDRKHGCSVFYVGKENMARTFRPQ